jgi:hypothetical protein
MKKYLPTAGAAALASALALGAAMPAQAAITTFATMSALTQDNIYFKNASTTNKSASATIYSIATSTATVPGSVGVKFSFINEGAALDTAVSGVNATFALSAATTTAAQNAFGYLIQPGINGTFSLLSTTAITVGSHTYAAGSNLLSATFTGAGIAGPKGSTSGSMDANNQNSGSTIVYTSDFVTFSPGASLDGAFSLTSITAALADVQAGTYALKTFKGDAGGSFSADPVPTANFVPEPASWALMLVGFGAVGGIARRRKQVHAV